MRLLKLIVLILGLLYLSFQIFNWLLTPPEFLNEPTSNKPLETKKPSKTEAPALSPQALNALAKQQATDAIDYINTLRQQLGLNPLTRQSQLDLAAENHSKYCVINYIQGHFEDPNHLGFTGKKPSDRAYAAGFPSGVNEVISFNRDSAKPFVDDLMSAIYHRLSLLSMTVDQIGTGVYRVPFSKAHSLYVSSAFTAETANQKIAQLCQLNTAPRLGETFYKGLCKDNHRVMKKAFDQAQYAIARHNPKLLFWPQDGATVPPVFYEEMPDPLPNCDASGYPVHIQINPIYWGRIRFVPNSFQLYQLKNGDRLRVVVERTMTNLNDPNHENPGKKDEWYALFPKLRLAWNGHYEAQVQTRENGQITTHRWQFSTPTLQHLTVFRSAQGNRTPLPIRVGDIQHIYFKPHECRASKESNLKSRYLPTVKLNVSFVDGQTLKLHLLKGRKGDKIELRYGPTQTLVTYQVQ